MTIQSTGNIVRLIINSKYNITNYFILYNIQDFESYACIQKLKISVNNRNKTLRIYFYILYDMSMVFAMMDII